METKSYSRACHFLRSLLIHTKNVIVGLSDNKAVRIMQFRQFMSKEQNFRGAGDDQKNFYRVIIREVKEVHRILFVIPCLPMASYKGYG
jgi:hypothetical protein